MLDQKKLFGTDGIRGRANEYPITPEVALRIGQSLGSLLKKKYPDQKQLRVLIGKDTRLSGYMLEQALASGLNSVGIWVQLTGPLPTPGIGFLVKNMRVSAGVIISASHNPYMDNGIKIFSSQGYKISLEEEKELEKIFFSKQTPPLAKLQGRTKRIVDSAGRYIVFVKSVFPLHLSLQGRKVVLDVANGSCYKVAPAIFSELGAEVILIGDKPDGFNINDRVGSCFPERISEKVRQEQADVGISLDGDGDRVIMCDEQGDILNGDFILGICALYLKKQNRLKNFKVVGTELSSQGLENTLKQAGIELIRTQVGDKYVVKKMQEEQVFLGGESSGHIIFLGQSSTGDGCIAALNVLACMVNQACKLSDLRKQIKDSPQISLNLPVKSKPPLDSLSGYQEFFNSLKSRLGDKNRVLIRYSGTEPFLRIFLEGDNKDVLKKELKNIQDFFNEKKHFSN